MNFSRLIILPSILSLAACFGCKTISRDEVANVKSPDGHLEAALYETNGGATTTFGYEVEIRKAGQPKGIQVAHLFHTLRNAQAYGLNMKWNGNDELDVEFLETSQPADIHSAAQIDGRNIRVLVKDGITDPAAPSGGMLYNLNRK